MDPGAQFIFALLAGIALIIAAASLLVAADGYADGQREKYKQGKEDDETGSD